MIKYNMSEAKTNFSKIAKLLEDKKEDMVIICRNNKPLLKVELYEENSRKNLFGSAKGMFTIPDNFDDIDITNDFEQEIFLN